MSEQTFLYQEQELAPALASSTESRNTLAPGIDGFWGSIETPPEALFSFVLWS